MRSKVSLQYVRVLHGTLYHMPSRVVFDCCAPDFRIPVSRSVIKAVRSDQIVCALLTYGYMRDPPRRITCFPGSWFGWTRHSHRFFGDTAVRARVWCVHKSCALRRGDSWGAGVRCCVCGACAPACHATCASSFLSLPWRMCNRSARASSVWRMCVLCDRVKAVHEKFLHPRGVHVLAGRLPT